MSLKPILRLNYPNFCLLGRSLISFFGTFTARSQVTELERYDEIVNPHKICRELIEVWVLQLSRHTHNSFKDLRDIELDRLYEYYDDFVWILEQEKEEQERQIKAAQSKR